MTTLREKVLQFMSLTLTGFDQTVRGIADQFRSAFKSGFGEDLPAEAAEAIEVAQRALRDNRQDLEDRVAQIYEKYFSEEEIDLLLEFHQSPVGKKLSQIGNEVQGAIAEESNAWVTRAMGSAEGDLARLLGVNTAQLSAQVPAAQQGA